MEKKPLNLESGKIFILFLLGESEYGNTGILAVNAFAAVVPSNLRICGYLFVKQI